MNTTPAPKPWRNRSRRPGRWVVAALAIAVLLVACAPGTATCWLQKSGAKGSRKASPPDAPVAGPDSCAPPSPLSLTFCLVPVSLAISARTA